MPRQSVSRAELNALNLPETEPAHAGSLCMKLTAGFELADQIEERGDLEQFRSRVRNRRYGRKSQRAEPKHPRS